MSPILLPEDEQIGSLYPYKPQIVLVFQDNDLPTGLQQLYLRTKDAPHRRFLSDEEQQLIPWDTLHCHPSFVFASFFLGPAVRDVASMKQYTRLLQETMKVRNVFKRSDVRKYRGHGHSVGERADQGGDLG